MGYNEPDLYGPACCNCDGKQSYYPATSSGWAPLFDPRSAATAWQKTVGKITSGTPRGGDGIRRIVSPAMANGAVVDKGVDCSKDPAVGSNPHRCNGWLSMFKTAALALRCTDFDGTNTNCWDVIDVIQIHACKPFVPPTLIYPTARPQAPMRIIPSWDSQFLVIRHARTPLTSPGIRGRPERRASKRGSLLHRATRPVESRLSHLSRALADARKASDVTAKLSEYYNVNVPPVVVPFVWSIRPVVAKMPSHRLETAHGTSAGLP